MTPASQCEPSSGIPQIVKRKKSGALTILMPIWQSKDGATSGPVATAGPCAKLFDIELSSACSNGLFSAGYPASSRRRVMQRAGCAGGPVSTEPSRVEIYRTSSWRCRVASGHLRAEALDEAGIAGFSRHGKALAQLADALAQHLQFEPLVRQRRLPPSVRTPSRMNFRILIVAEIRCL